MKFWAGVLMMAWCVAICSGCRIEETNGTKVSDLTYEIMEDADIPQELLDAVTQKKAADFKMTYTDGAYFYIVRGYGEQETGGYSIRVKECYLTSNAILFDTELVGPRKGENTAKSPSYPYIIVKTEKREENVVFD